MRRPRAAAATAAGALLALLALLAACGSGGSSEPSSSTAPSPSATTSASSPSSSATVSAQTQAWADRFCSAARTWKDQVSSAGAQLRDRQNLSVNKVKQSLRTMATATSDFASEVRDLGSPGTAAGDRLQQDLSRLADTLDAQRQLIGDILDGVTTPQQLTSQLPALTAALTTMVTAFASTAQDIANLDVTDELKQAFESSSECRAAGIG